MIMLAANFTWRGRPVDVVVPVGERPKKKALDWSMRFQAEISDRVGRGERDTVGRVAGPLYNLRLKKISHCASGMITGNCRV